MKLNFTPYGEVLCTRIELVSPAWKTSNLPFVQQSVLRDDGVEPSESEDIWFTVRTATSTG